MSARGAMITVLWTELAAAMRADDMRTWAGLNIPQDHAEVGPAVAAWIRKMGDDYMRAMRLAPNPTTFQSRVHVWMLDCFGDRISFDGNERNHRFLEESLELVQALGCTKSEASQLVDYVYDRPKGTPVQEVGGVMVTLAALCSAHHMDMSVCGETEAARIWLKINEIRAKQAAKPKHSPLPS